MRRHEMTRPRDYADPLHKKYAGTPLEAAGKELQSVAYYPHLGWAYFAQDFELALAQYKAAGGAL